MPGLAGRGGLQPPALPWSAGSAQGGASAEGVGTRGHSHWARVDDRGQSGQPGGRQPVAAERLCWHWAMHGAWTSHGPRLRCPGGARDTPTGTRADTGVRDPPMFLGPGWCCSDRRPGSADVVSGEPRETGAAGWGRRGQSHRRQAGAVSAASIEIAARQAPTCMRGDRRAIRATRSRMGRLHWWVAPSAWRSTAADPSQVAGRAVRSGRSR